MTKEQIEEVKEIMRNPNEERCLEISNDVSEMMWDDLDKVDLMMALCYWRMKWDELSEKTNREYHDQRMERLFDQAEGLIRKETPNLPLAKDVPLFWADPKNKDFLIRETDGKQERVSWSLKTNQFEVVEGEQK